MINDYPYNKSKSLKLVSKIKEYFFCGAEENFHWTDCAWLLSIGFVVLLALVVTLI